MPRKTPQIELKPNDKEVLSRWANSRTLPKQTVDRASMILNSEAGKPVMQIAQGLNTYPNKVIYWRQRYLENGLEGLQDKARSGRPSIYGKTLLNDVLKLLSKPPPKGLAIPITKWF